MMRITFLINYYTIWGEKLYITGSIPELGMWNATQAKEMYHVGNGNWILSLDIPETIQPIEYKYFVGTNVQKLFEQGKRKHTFYPNGISQSYSLYDYWQNQPENPVFCSSAFTKGFFAQRENVQLQPDGKKLLSFIVSTSPIEADEVIAVSGNQDYLGNWDPRKAPVLSCNNYSEWRITLPAGSDSISYPLEYKFFIRKKDSAEPIYWEQRDNRIFFPVEDTDSDLISIATTLTHEQIPEWKCAGSVIPVFSLRSEKSFGIGDLGDLRLLVDWVKETNQRIIQVLPMNDTTMTYSWLDSYPYSAISIYALHPIYVCLHELGELNDPEKKQLFAEKQKELNAFVELEYEEVIKYKLEYCRLFFEQEGNNILHSKEFLSFKTKNENWLLPYAAYGYLRDKYQTSDFNYWEEYAIYNPEKASRLCGIDGEGFNSANFTYFLQYILHTQFQSASEYARVNGVVLKGDLPIGVNRTSVDAWMEPQYFNMNSQAGAPPDDFSAIGQNWGFPTYNWENMQKDNFAWWKKRFKKLEDYFDCFRIDHILGFFRIWEIPFDYIEGLCGHFNPALPLSKQEIEQYGFPFDEEWFTTPKINQVFLPELFGEFVNEVTGSYLHQISANHFILKENCNTQRKIEQLFEGKTDLVSFKIKQGLFTIANEVLFLKDPNEIDHFHPRIAADHSFFYKELSENEKNAFGHLYWEFFYQRHNDFWKQQAYNRLTPLVEGTNMLVCGEDLGMIPESVPEVMTKLNILSLEIERMPKAFGREFTDMFHLPYLSVCTTSTHDMSPIRNWWKEDKLKTQRYYNNVLQHQGTAPDECSDDMATQIVSNHLNTNSMLVILPLQDWFATDSEIRNPDISKERINVPANPKHYWRYRMHITLESLLVADRFNKKIIELIKSSGRK